MQVVVIAGGLATRLGDITANRPKVLLPVGGRPFLDLLLDRLAVEDVTTVHLCLGHHAGQVLDHLARRPANLPVTTSVEPAPLGTAGCLRHALPWLRERFLVAFGDTFTPVRLAPVMAALTASGRPAVMAVLRNRDVLETSNVRIRDGLVVEYDKSAPPGTYEYVDYGVAALERGLVAGLEHGCPADLGELFAPLIAAGRLAAYEVSTRFWEIGSLGGYAELDARVRGAGAPDGSEPVPG
jgi:NDP-sugar pyrophosphorylase family protein